MSEKERTLGRLEAQAEHSLFVRQVALPLRRFIQTEERSGWPLLVATLAALAWANSPWSDGYAGLWKTTIAVDLSFVRLAHDLKGWVNDAVLPLFFFVIGVEIKHELVQGELSRWRRAALPLAMAFGGILAPAAIYLACTTGTQVARGWAVPVATDVAFALAVLALLGRRVPYPLKVIVLAFAVIDDIGGVLIIALFYSQQIAAWPLILATTVLALIAALAVAGVRSTALFILLGLIVWFVVLESGVHATIAGVVLGLLVPARAALSREDFLGQARELMARYEDARDRENEETEAGNRSTTGPDARDEQYRILGQIDELSAATEAPSERYLRLVNPWVTYVVLPVFAFANAGVVLSAGMLGDLLTAPHARGILLGLVIGKPLGIFVAAVLAVRLRLAELPNDLDRRHVLGMGLVAGIGFTVALFMNELAFRGSPETLEQGKVAIFLASLLAGCFALLLLARGRGVDLETVRGGRKKARPRRARAALKEDVAGSMDLWPSSCELVFRVVLAAVLGAVLKSGDDEPEG